MRAPSDDRDAGPDPDPDSDPDLGPDPDRGPGPHTVTPLDRIAAVGARAGRVSRVAAKLDALAAERGRAEGGPPADPAPSTPPGPAAAPATGNGEDDEG